MARSYSTKIQPSNSTDALFRAWTTWVRDVFLNGGWVQTTDTGQMDFTTITRPLVANTPQGKIIVRMDDDLQATHPIYAKIEFGSGSNANYPAIWVTLGTGSDGAGLTTGDFFGPTQAAANNHSTSLAPPYSFGSASTSHATFVMGDGTSTNVKLMFSIERGRDDDGAELGEVVYVMYAASNGVMKETQYLLPANGSSQATLQTSQYFATPNGSIYLPHENVGFARYPMWKETGSPARLEPAPPALGFIATFDGFFADEAILGVYMYGTPHYYKRLRFTTAAGGGLASGIGGYSLWVRFE
jgi:hypothetical protein